MNEFAQLPDGEYFVDKPIKEHIPAASEWESLSINQLLDVQVSLQNRLWGYQNSPVIAAQLRGKLTELQSLIARRLADGR